MNRRLYQLGNTIIFLPILELKDLTIRRTDLSESTNRH